MKYLLLDIDDTIAPLTYRGLDAVVIDTMGIELAIPKYVAEWLKHVAAKEIHIVWCTSRPPVVCSLIEKKIGFKATDYLQFFNKKAYHWMKLSSIIEFCQAHENDLVVLADNDIREGTRGIQNLPTNLKMVWPSDSCLAIEDLEMIERL